VQIVRVEGEARREVTQSSHDTRVVAERQAAIVRKDPKRFWREPRSGKRGTKPETPAIEAPLPAIEVPTGPAVRVSARRWALACGVHTAARPLELCPVCARAAEETVARVDELMSTRGHAGAGTKAVATKIERYGSARHGAPPPKSNAVTLREARRKAAAR
jgi:hypothetical protein